MPSTTSTVVSMPFASSTDVVPSRPTRSSAEATISPIVCVVMGGDGRDLHALRVIGHGPRELAQPGDDDLEPAVEAALQVDGARTGGNVPDPVGEMAVASSVDVVVPSPTSSPVRSAA